MASTDATTPIRRTSRPPFSPAITATTSERAKRRGVAAGAEGGDALHNRAAVSIPVTSPDGILRHRRRR
jgi:hypothetical protein